MAISVNFLARSFLGSAFRECSAFASEVDRSEACPRRQRCPDSRDPRSPRNTPRHRASRPSSTPPPSRAPLLENTPRTRRTKSSSRAFTQPDQFPLVEVFATET
uniref:Secreted protein n=1 Tax=Steinernema glaseri TaxID=37863 RepID=A0A1I7Z0D7_9BILA